MNENIVKGEKFLSKCVFDGLAHSYDVISQKWVKPYPEVTGYILTYFCGNYNAIQPNILEAADKLVELQEKKTGGYFTFYENQNLYTFDSAQILIGLLSIYSVTLEKKYYEAALRAGCFIKNMQNDNGSFAPAFNINKGIKYDGSEIYKPWNGPYSGLNAKIIEAMRKLYEITGEKYWLECVAKSVEFYQYSKYIEPSHPLGYWLEGLLAAGKYNIIIDIVKNKVIPRIQTNGFISYTNKVSYSYVSGAIQLGILLWKVGYLKEARAIMEYGRSVQNHYSNGGLFQYATSKGLLDSHIHTEQNSWGTKYYCQLERLVEMNDVRNEECIAVPRLYKKMYNEFWPKASQKIYKLIIDNIDNSTDNICEIGCASAHILAMLYIKNKELYNTSHKFTGIEIRKEIFNKIKRMFDDNTINVNLINQDAFCLKGHFDLIYSTGLLQCFSSEERKCLIEYLSKKCRKAIFVVPRIYSDRNSESNMDVGVDGRKEYITDNIELQCLNVFKHVKSGLWSKNELNLDDDFLYFVCEHR